MRPATVLFLCLGLSAPVVAQELPKPTEVGTKALDALVARGVDAGRMREFRDAEDGRSHPRPDGDGQAQSDRRGRPPRRVGRAK